jgi:hypothetical protein
MHEMNKSLWTAAALGCAEQSFGQTSIGQTFVKLFERHYTSCFSAVAVACVLPCFTFSGIKIADRS